MFIINFLRSNHFSTCPIERTTDDFSDLQSLFYALKEISYENTAKISDHHFPLLPHELHKMILLNSKISSSLLQRIALVSKSMQPLGEMMLMEKSKPAPIQDLPIDEQRFLLKEIKNILALLGSTSSNSLSLTDIPLQMLKLEYRLSANLLRANQILNSSQELFSCPKIFEIFMKAGCDCGETALYDAFWATSDPNLECLDLYLQYHCTPFHLGKFMNSSKEIDSCNKVNLQVTGGLKILDQITMYLSLEFPIFHFDQKISKVLVKNIMQFLKRPQYKKLFSGSRAPIFRHPASGTTDKLIFHYFPDFNVYLWLNEHRKVLKGIYLSPLFVENLVKQASLSQLEDLIANKIIILNLHLAEKIAATIFEDTVIELAGEPKKVDHPSL